jgi:hypothetical protein
MGSALPRLPRKRVSPRFTRGDVLATFDPDTWVGHWIPLHYRLMYSAVAVLIACARMSFNSVSNATLADYDAGTLTFRSRKSRRYPVILLPVAVAAIERYLVLRRKLGGTVLFVGDTGKPIDPTGFANAFGTVGRRFGLDGRDVHKRLVAYFDRCLVGERDLAAVVVLKHGTQGDARRNVTRSEVRAATADIERLRGILFSRHPFRGAPGRWLDGHGKSKILEETILFKPIRSSVTVTDFMREDPVCARLLGLTWVSTGVEQRADIVRDDLPYLADLEVRKLITWAQMGHLLNCDPKYAQILVKKMLLAAETPVERERRLALEGQWDGEARRLYRARPDRLERPRVFFARMVAAGYPFEWGRMLWTLQRAELTPAQIARKQRKAAPSGKKKKSETTRSR